jgi:tetratricopeptide (TPR) repeat protein
MNPVTAKLEKRSIPTYGLGKPEKNPVFFEKRVYQGSCGKVYPVPFIDKVYQDEAPKPVDYVAARLENEFVRLVMLPEIGGRIFLGQDKANRNYDFFYRQDVIKPALVGLAGPWISGGVEFNWPQHHRPGTYLPADVTIEDEGGGAFTVWQSEHDPLNRLKGMHGIRLRPGSALVELRGRLYNRTPLTQTFLWWANVAARVHENYQSFFPSDVHYVADHAVRAMSSFPIAENFYYGVDYSARPGANDLAWYKNIPVPTSYMVCQTQEDFFGGYDHEAQGGFVHVANKHISPGKKQWTWGNHEFGWAWDRELTDNGGPYVELMAGVFTDNQPDFSYLAPYETKTFSQFWWPYQKLGPVQQANTLAALRLVVHGDRSLDFGLAVSRPLEGLRVVLKDGDRVILDETATASPDAPWQRGELRFTGDSEASLCAWVFNSLGEAVIGFRPPDSAIALRNREVATEPSAPEDIASTDELYLTGEHLDLYRHPTRYPEIYWEAALQRDPKDSRCNIALGRLNLSRGEFDAAAKHFEVAVSRLTFRHPNPETGEAHYFLGLVRRFQGNSSTAYTLFAKASWNLAWRAAANYELTCLDLKNGDAAAALQHVEESLETNATNNKACVLKAICLRKLGRVPEAIETLEALLAIDRLDHWALAEWALHQNGSARLSPLSRNDAQTALDIAFDYADCGCLDEAVSILENHHGTAVQSVAVPNPLERSASTHYALAWIYDLLAEKEKSQASLRAARDSTPDYLCPSRLHEAAVLEWALAQPGPDRNAAYGLGNFLFDKKRHLAAIAAWETARTADGAFATAHRNLGIAYWNARRDAAAARASYENALACDPTDSRLVSEFVQLRAKLGDSAAARLGFLESHRALVLERDDATVELATLYNETAQPQKALNLLASRSFHPWEGGEGRVLRQYTSARLLLGQAALAAGNAEDALGHFKLAMETPDRLGEKYHLLQAKADVTYWQGKALRALGREAEALAKFEAAAAESGDFQSMTVTAFSELTVFKALALRELGREAEACEVLEAIAVYARAEMDIPAKIDYFATSLPNLLVFEEDIQEAKKTQMEHLLNQSLRHLPLASMEIAGAPFKH